MPVSVRDKFAAIQERLQLLEGVHRDLVGQAAAVGRHLAAMAQELRDLAGLAGQEVVPTTGGYRIIENGQSRWVTEKEVEDLRKSSQAHLILDVPQMKLRYVRMIGKKTDPPVWTRVSWAKHNVLLVGMRKPAQAFGDLSVSQATGHHQLSPRTLSRYMADITRLIQGGGTHGPYVNQTTSAHGFSSSGWGYQFDSRWNYLVIESANTKKW